MSTQKLKMSTDQTSPEEKVPVYGGALPAPDVHEMVKADPSNIPARYMRNLDEIQKGIDISHAPPELPLIDLSLLSEHHEEEREKLDKACKDWGFFQVVNHGIENELLQKMKDAARLFFDLPLEEKKKFSMPLDDIEGYGHSFVFSEEQKLDWNDALVLTTFPLKMRRYKFWPTTPKALKETVEKYSSELRRVAEQLLHSISFNMGWNSKSLPILHKELVQTMRMNYYPPCCKPDQVIGFSRHSDASSITILLQDDNIIGLQLQRDGKWLPVKPIPNALVVNIGDIMEIWSNGKYKSIEHRAVTNENKARMSFATFFYPPHDQEIEPLDNKVDSQKVYKKVIYGDYLKDFMNAKMEGKSQVERTKVRPECNI